VTRTSWQKFEDEIVLSVRLTKGWRPTADRYGISIARVKTIVKRNARRERMERLGLSPYPPRWRDPDHTKAPTNRTTKR
jgi:hypothetical protein